MNVLVLVTAGNKKEAENIASGLVKEKLAACINIIGGVYSLFRWGGKIDSANEALMLIKTRKTLLNKLIKKVKSLHSYDVPEIICLPIISGEKKYLEWLNECTRPGA